MIYKYRWIAVILLSACMFLSFFLYFLSPLLNRLHAFKQREQEYSKNIAYLKKNSNLYKIKPKAITTLPAKESVDNLANLVFLLQKNSLAVQSIKPLKQVFRQSLQFDLFEVKAQANFQQLLTFLSDCADSSSLIILLNFSFYLQKNKTLQLVLDVMLLKNGMTVVAKDVFKIVKPKKAMGITSPFCTESTSSLSSPLSTTGIELSSMRYIGYLQLGLQKEAFILLANGKVLSVHPGSILGSEHGMVLAVLKDRLTIKLPDQTTWTMYK